MSSSERRSLLDDHNSTQQSHHQDNINSRSSSEWSENENDGDGGESSCYSSIYSNSSESFANEWETFITDDKRLFYIEFNPITLSKNEKTENSLLAAKNQFSRASTRRSNKASKLSRFVGKSGKATSQLLSLDGTPTTTETKVKFSEASEGETKELYLCLDPTSRYRYGRRSSICESLLGLSVSPFSDGQRLMISNFMPNFNCNNNIIKIGDWLKNINNVEINSTNLDEILLSFTEPSEILLKLQKMSDEEAIQVNEIEYGRITSLGMICDMLERFLAEEHENENYLEGFQDTFSLMYLTMEGLEEQGPEGQDVLYCYPQKHENFLYTSRGSFLTLNSILKTGFNSTPDISTISFASTEYNISFTTFNEDLLLLAVRNDILTKNELRFKTQEIINYFELMHRNLSENFYPQNLVNMNCYCKLLKMEMLNKKTPIFEQGLLQPHYVPLPKEAQLRIDDALSEMEAMDYREWNSEPLKSQREFFIVGSLLYFKSFLLASHLPPPDLLDIESFLRMNGVFNLLSNNKNITIKELVIWNEIYPKNCFSDMKRNNMAPPQGRWFLAVIGISQMLLVAILEYRCSDADNNYSNKKVEPSPFYVEEIQDTLDHLKLGGIEKLASTWILHNQRPQINLDSESRTVENVQHLKPKAELISILKRKNNSTENVGGGGGSSSVHSQTVSEDSDRKFSQNDEEEESDSDWDGFPSDSQKSSSGFDMSEMTETLLKEVSDILPTKITAGVDNVLFHYVQIEVGEAYVLAPTNIIENDIIQIFRQSCHLIHTVLQNTVKFRKILSEDGQKPQSSSTQHRSLVAIKEHGILFNVKNEKDEVHEFWVIGRLFNSPVRELYICHRADVPQNLVEIAFRLNLHTAG